MKQLFSPTMKIGDQNEKKLISSDLTTKHDNEQHSTAKHQRTELLFGKRTPVSHLTKRNNLQLNKTVFFAVFIISFLLTNRTSAQIEPQTIKTETIEPMNLNGPRLGFTYIGYGEIADKLNERGISPFVTQFGWQLETRFFTLPNGVSGLIEAVGLIGGLEQNTFLPSASLLIGIRSANGFEVGLGPNLSIAGAAIVIAGGVTIRSNYINFPLNFAIVPSNKGVRVSFLFGFNANTSTGFNLFN